jgi:hypothetical protein
MRHGQYPRGGRRHGRPAGPRRVRLAVDVDWQLGEVAWRRLLALLQGEAPDYDVVFRPRLVIRTSTAAPRAT